MHRWNLSQRTDVHCFHRKIILHKSSELPLRVFTTATTSFRQRTFRMLTHFLKRCGHLILHCKAANAARRHPHVAWSANHQSHYYYELVGHRPFLSKIFQGLFTSSEIGAKGAQAPYFKLPSPKSTGAFTGSGSFEFCNTLFLNRKMLLAEGRFATLAFEALTSGL